MESFFSQFLAPQLRMVVVGLASRQARRTGIGTINSGMNRSGRSEADRSSTAVFVDNRFWPGLLSILACSAKRHQQGGSVFTRRKLSTSQVAAGQRRC
jgi:hypothetical protein